MSLIGFDVRLGFESFGTFLSCVFGVSEVGDELFASLTVSCGGAFVSDFGLDTLGGYSLDRKPGIHDSHRDLVSCSSVSSSSLIVQSSLGRILVLVVFPPCKALWLRI